MILCTPDTRWKYLRENTKKYFNPNRNTPLNEYLEAIFPDNKFLYNSSVPKEDLPNNTRYRRFICDAICKEIKLVVEFDGVNHYMDTQVCINDVEKDKYLNDLGYKVVRIPYWIQLSRTVIKNLFNIEVKDNFCLLDCSFFSPEKGSVDPNILPGNMCQLGRRRFIREFNSFDEEIRIQIWNDLVFCCYEFYKTYKEYSVEYITPSTLMHKLNIPDSKLNMIT